jgi:iron complex transport system substrate-binding protein
VERQKRVPIEFEGLKFEEAFRADLVVNDCVVVEVKSVNELAEVHYARLSTYLRLLDYRLGLILNFGAPLMKHGIKRIANRL